MRVMVLDHHGKTILLRQALADGGFEVVEPTIDGSKLTVDLNVDAILVDTDSPHAVPEWKHPIAKSAAKQGVPIVLYPHGGPPALEYDGIRPFYLPISLQLVHGEGEQEIHRRIRHPVRSEVVGWSYCPMRGGRLRGVGVVPVGVPDALSEGGRGSGPLSLNHLLFAPLHPWADGRTINPIHKRANRQAYEAFLTHPAPRKTVRLIGEDSAAGIRERHPDIQYVQASERPLLDHIDEADAIISIGSLPYYALARGKPTVIYGVDIPQMNDECTKQAAHWAEYQDLFRYPAPLEDGDLDELFGRDTAWWEHQFVGEPLDPDAVCDAVASVRPNRATRRHLARIK